MRTKKIRGHKRIWKQITHWKNANLKLDLEYLKTQHREYIKVYVSPYCDYSLLNSEFPVPKGKTRKYILKSLVDIFNSWKTQLETLNQPYYLAIWLFENNIQKSQVVCAIDSFIDFYDATFYHPEEQRQMPIQNFGKLKEELAHFDWVYAKDQNYFTQQDIQEEQDYFLETGHHSKLLKWYLRKLKETPASCTDDYGNTTYYLQHDTVWIGTKKHIDF